MEPPVIRVGKRTLSRIHCLASVEFTARATALDRRHTHGRAARRMGAVNL